ncbi:MAG: hypothetical protein CME65_15645 [Halobacteriovoraceae bacterium]|nr:hypothetical protein [Halobacteriovoraceae bacterium]
MVVTKKYLIAAVFLIVWVEQVFAETANKVKIIYNAVSQKGSGGYQVIDESQDQDIVVQEPMLLLQVGLDEDIFMHGMFAYDTWTSASDKAFDDATSASLLHRQERESFNLGVTWDKKTHGLSFTLGQSSEWDYKSNYFSVGGYHNFAQDNFSIAFNYSFYDDQTKLFDVSEDETKDFESKKTEAMAFDMSQILTPTDLLLFGHHVITQTGTLEGTLNTININGTRTEEILPNFKLRQASYVKWIHSLDEEQALHLSYRSYNDSWAINSQTFEISYLKSLMDDEAYIEVFFRHYTQSQYSNFETSFDSSQEFMTSDADYEKLSSNQIGFFYNQEMEVFDYEAQFVLGVSHYERDNNLSYDTAQISFGVSF